MRAIKKYEFKCSHCGKWVSLEAVGTKQRNHCPFCLWSRHIDLKKAGDREAKCGGDMEPIGLTFKNEGKDKYGELRQGELMLIHKCVICGKISINRIAGDDDSKEILKVFKLSQKVDSETIKQLGQKGIKLLSGKDKREIYVQLFGKDFKNF